MFTIYDPRPLFTDRQAKKILLTWALACLLIVAAIWAGMIIEIKTDRENAIKQAETLGKSRVASYAEQLERTIDQIDELSLMIAYQYETKGIKLDLREQFRYSEHYTPIYSLVLNAQGIGSSPRDASLNHIDMSDLPMFRQHRRSKSRDLLINPPSIGRASLAGKQVIRFTRRLNNPDGSFNGVVLVVIEPDYLKSYIDESKSEVLSVIFRNGMPFTTQSEQASKPVINLYAQPQDFSAPDGFLHEPEEKFLDGQARLVAWRQLRHYPLITLAATKEADVLVSISVQYFPPFSVQYFPLFQPADACLCAA